MTHLKQTSLNMARNLEECLARPALCSDTVGLHDLNLQLNGIKQNKTYSSNVNLTKEKVKQMDILDCSTAADTADLEHDYIKLVYKTINYNVKHKCYDVDTYKFVECGKCYSNGLFNGWLLNTNDKYTVYNKSLPPYNVGSIRDLYL